MTLAFGPTGFTPTTVDDEVAALNTLIWTTIDPGLDLDPDQPMGQAIAAFAEDYAELTELVATIYNAFNPDAAEGNLLANLAAISGTRPQVATYSTVTCALLLNAGTTVPAGATAYVTGQPGNVWTLVNPVTNSGSIPGTFSGLFQSAQPGPQTAPALTLAVIASPQTGWISVYNPGPSTPGQSADTDTTLRQRREAELEGGGSADVDAVRSAVLKTGVYSAFVFENTTNVTDSYGVPPHSIHVIVWDGYPTYTVSNSAIAQAIWQAKGQGVQAYGSTTQTVTDSQGYTHTIGFDRCAVQYINVACTTTPSTLTTAQTAAVKTALTAYAEGASYTPAAPLVTGAWQLGASILALPFHVAAIVPGVTTDVPTFAFDTTSTPTNTGNITLTGLQIAVINNITVNGV